MRLAHFVLVSGAACLFSCTYDPSGARTDQRAADAGEVSAPDAAEVGAPDSTPAPDGTPATPDAAVDPCGMPPTGAWAGRSRIQHNGGGGYDYLEAEVTWTLASTDGCVDTFHPAGTLRSAVVNSGGSSESESPVAAGDGTLVIDRTAAIATYTIHGGSSDDPWADHTGTFDGVVFAGANNEGTSHLWSFARVDAVLTAPTAPACSEPATDHWTSEIVVTGMLSSAETTWTRTGTTGCVDTFAPSGTAHRLPGGTLEFDPDHGAIAAGDSALTIDRSTDPATWTIDHAYTSWPAQLIYTYEDGTTTTSDGNAYSFWADTIDGAYDGDHFAAQLPSGDRWTFARGE